MQGRDFSEMVEKLEDWTHELLMMREGLSENLKDFELLLTPIMLQLDTLAFLLAQINGARCFKCSSTNLKFIGKDFIEAKGKKMNLPLLQCKKCGHKF